MIRAGDLVFDIGAHKGEKTRAYLSAGARVVAVEPQARLAEMLRAEFPGLTVIPKACGAREGKAILHTCAASWLATCIPEKWRSGRFHGYEWNNGDPVEMTTLDALIKEYGMPDFVKIDVEGYEIEVLRGLSHPLRWLSFEFTAEFLDDARKCVDMLNILGNYVYAASVYGASEPSLSATLAFEYNAAPVVFYQLSTIPDPLLWGDIYARLK